MRGTTREATGLGSFSAQAMAEGCCDTEILDVQQGPARVQWAAGLVNVCLYDRGKSEGTALLKPPQIETMRCSWCRADCLFGLRLAVISAVPDASEACQFLQPCGLTVIEVVSSLLHLQQCDGNMGRGGGPERAEVRMGGDTGRKQL